MKIKQILISSLNSFKEKFTNIYIKFKYLYEYILKKILKATGRSRYQKEKAARIRKERKINNKDNFWTKNFNHISDFHFWKLFNLILNGLVYGFLLILLYNGIHIHWGILYFLAAVSQLFCKHVKLSFIVPLYDPFSSYISSMDYTGVLNAICENMEELKKILLEKENIIDNIQKELDKNKIESSILLEKNKLDKEAQIEKLNDALINNNNLKMLAITSIIIAISIFFKS
jgi:hypothetical protein